jgi:hypothetical protein
LYVGETDSFKRRWHGRLQNMYQMGVINTGPVSLPPFPLTVYFGNLSTPPKDTRSRKAVEHALIRTLEGRPRQGSRRSRTSPAPGQLVLRNSSSFREFETRDTVTIRNLLPGVYVRRGNGVQYFDANRNVLSIPRGVRYELPVTAPSLELFP